MTKKLKKTTAFLSAVTMVMAMLLNFPSGMFSNIDFGLKQVRRKLHLQNRQKTVAYIR
ncbi:MAG: hypothetical protein ACI4I9_09700 [Porcipelethomonas sp.]